MDSRRGRAGFTIIEMLVVISITVILLGLIFGPIIQSFNLTRRARAMVMAQDTARNTLERISRETSQAMFVYDNSNSPLNFPVQQPNGNREVFQALYGKIDIILPKLLMHCNDPNHPEGSPREYERGDEAWPPCPVCGSTDVEARPKEPLTADSTIVRYFVGLADPDPDADTNVSPAGQARDWPEAGAPLNGFVLYRAEFDPYDKNLVKFDDNNQPILDDPGFFYDASEAPNGKPYWRNWKTIAKPVVPQTDIDLVHIRMDDKEKAIVGVAPSVRFQLTQITNDSFAPAFTSDEAAEAPLAIPTVFRATYGFWGSSFGPNTPDIYNVSLIRYGSDRANPTSGMTWFRTAWEPNGHLVIYKYTNTGGWSSTPIFDITGYVLTKTFTPVAEPDVAFLVDPVKGEARFEFPASDEIQEGPQTDPNTIAGMNENVRLHWGSATEPPTRAYRISMFRALTPELAYQPRIVPGSEVVTGPDISPGLPLDQIRMVRYERVPFNLGDPGRNQYKIDYGTGDRTGERVGWVIFSPALDEAIPQRMFDGAQTGPSRIEIRYKYQLNHDGDVVIGNYSTKTLLSITLGIRFYDRGSGKCHPVELTNKVRVRNLMR